MYKTTQKTVDNGGFSARKAMVRWALRLFKREWRSQFLVLLLLTLAVATAIFSACTAYNIAPTPGNAKLGSANYFIQFNVVDAEAMKMDIDYAKEKFGVIDVITRRFVPIPGSIDSLEVRGQNPQGPYSEPMLALLDGRHPTAAGEIAVTDKVAEMFMLEIGGSLEVDGDAFSVVGVVENPSDLNDEFALIPASLDVLPNEVTILVDGTEDDVFWFRAPSSAMTTRSMRPGNEDVTATMAALSISTIAMLLIGLVAAASFAVIAHRRLRQLGMLAAIGATGTHLRLVTVANGVIIGVIAAVMGMAIGVCGWFIAVPFMETAAGFRIDSLNLPWWIVISCIFLAIATATLAAWGPARTVARSPITQALSGRPAKPKTARYPNAVTLTFIVVGFVSLVLARQNNLPLIIIGMLAIAVGVLFTCHFVLKILPKIAGWFPVGIRLALRDLARHQSRSGAALIAITLVLAIVAAGVISISVAYHSAGKGNLSEYQLLIGTGTSVNTDGVNIDGPFIWDMRESEIENFEAEVKQMAASLSDATVIGLDVAYDPKLGIDPSIGKREVITLGGKGNVMGNEMWMDVSLLYVATPELLQYYDLNFDALDLETELLTVETGEVRYQGVLNQAGRQETSNAKIITPGYSSLPNSFMTPDALAQRGWETVRIGWLLETNEPLTSEQLAMVRNLAADVGLTMESRNHQEGLLALRSQAIVLGMLLALAILFMTVGLIRSTASGDLRTLTATGATSSIRKTLTAATSGALATLGAVLGTAFAYLTIIAVYAGELSVLTPVPINYLLVIIIVIPLVAVSAGWLMAGDYFAVRATPIRI